MLKMPKNENAIVITSDNWQDYVNDKRWWIRRMVALAGYGLDQLANDEQEYVRVEVAKHGYNLAQFIKDESMPVRRAAAEWPETHKILFNDKEWQVKALVIRRGDIRFALKAKSDNHKGIVAAKDDRWYKERVWAKAHAREAMLKAKELAKEGYNYAGYIGLEIEGR